MANTRKKLEKENPDFSNVSNQKFYCCSCGTAYRKREGNFSVSHSPMYRGTKYLAMCRECADSMFHRYLKEFDNERDAMRRVCMKLDLYWSHAIADMVEASPNVSSYVRNYIAKSNINRFINKTYDDTIREEESGKAALPVESEPLEEPEMIVEEEVTLEEVKEILVPPKLLKFWGTGLSPEMYFELEERFQYLTSRYPKNYKFDLGEEMLLRRLSSLEIEINHDQATGKPTDKNVALLNQLLGSANLKPTQKAAEEVDTKLENMPLGVGLHKWERERPLPPNPPSLNDVSHLIKNVTTWFHGHTSKMIGLKNSHCQLYEEAMEEFRVSVEGYEEDEDDTFLSEYLNGITGGLPNEEASDEMSDTDGDDL